LGFRDLSGDLDPFGRAWQVDALVAAFTSVSRAAAEENRSVRPILFCRTSGFASARSVTHGLVMPVLLVAVP
jgi:phosphoribosyl-dephospho-CoA transferase